RMEAEGGTAGRCDTAGWILRDHNRRGRGRTTRHAARPDLALGAASATIPTPNHDARGGWQPLNPIGAGRNTRSSANARYSERAGLSLPRPPRARTISE